VHVAYLPMAPKKSPKSGSSPSPGGRASIKSAATAKSMALSRDKGGGGGGGPAPTATKSEKKKKEVSGEMLADIEYLKNVKGDAIEKDLRKVVSFFAAGRERKSKEILGASCDAIARICLDGVGFVRFVEADQVETIAAVAGEPSEAGGKYSAIAVDGLCRGATAWLENVDPVDFSELSRLLYLALWLGGIDEDVAVAAVDAMMRFTRHRAEHAMGMLQAGVLNVLHRLLGVHRGPEFVSEVCVLLYLLCDMPVEAAGEHVLEELGLIKTIIDFMKGAPLNLRLQVAGLRLLALWATRLRTQEEIPEAIDKAGAKKLLEGAVEKLSSGGFEHAATWLTCIAQRAFTDGLKLED